MGAQPPPSPGSVRSAQGQSSAAPAHTGPEARGAFGLPGEAEEPFRARIIFSEEYGEYIRERVWSEDQAIETLPDGGVELAFTAGSKYYLLSWLLQFGGSAELLEPESLREEILEAARELVDIYAQDGES